MSYFLFCNSQIIGLGVPEEAIKGMADFCTAIAQGEFDFPDSTLERLIGQKPETLKNFLKKAYKL